MAADTNPNRQRPPDPRKQSTPAVVDRGARKDHSLAGKADRPQDNRHDPYPQLHIRRRFHCGRSGWAVEVSDDVLGNIVLAHHRHRATAEEVAAGRAAALGLQVRP